MKCADPILCYNDGQTRKFRHFSLANSPFKLLHNQVFNCGKCIFCRKKKSYELAIRCVLHASLHPQNCFLTLTYDETKPEYHNNLQYSDIQKFKKKLRRYCEYHHNKKVQIFNVHEYGKNGKKHWHLVVFNHDFSEHPPGLTKSLHTTRNGNNLYTSKHLEKLWPFGFNTIGNVTEASAMYQSQYTQKDLKNGNSTNNKKSKSKHSGIGREYFLLHYEQILSLGFIPFGGKKIPIPRYFQKIAHKHYSHFYETQNFFDTSERKRLYTPFKNGMENKHIADLYIKYRDTKLIYIDQLTQEWEQSIEPYIHNKNKPDFMKSAENYYYDLNNKLTKENF